jgi:hypothetical protein
MFLCWNYFYSDYYVGLTNSYASLNSGRGVSGSFKKGTTSSQAVGVPARATSGRSYSSSTSTKTGNYKSGPNNQGPSYFGDISSQSEPTKSGQSSTESSDYESRGPNTKKSVQFGSFNSAASSQAEGYPFGSFNSGTSGQQGSYNSGATKQSVSYKNGVSSQSGSYNSGSSGQTDSYISGPPSQSDNNNRGASHQFGSFDRSKKSPVKESSDSRGTGYYRSVKIYFYLRYSMLTVKPFLFFNDLNNYNVSYLSIFSRRPMLEFLHNCS